MLDREEMDEYTSLTNYEKLFLCDIYRPSYSKDMQKMSLVLVKEHKRLEKLGILRLSRMELTEKGKRFAKFHLFITAVL